MHETDPPGKKKTKNDVRKETVKPSLAKLLEVEGNTLGVIELIRDSPIGEFVRGNASSIKAVSNGLKTTGNVFSGAGIVFETVEVGQGNMSWTEFGVDSTISAAAIFTSYVTVTVAGASVAPFVAGGALIYFGGKAIYEYSSGNTLFTKPTK